MDGSQDRTAGRGGVDAEPMNDTIRALLNRRSIRKYTDQPVSEATISGILKAAFRAPTSSNIQAYSVVVVRDAETKKRLSVVTKNQKHVAECPVFLAFCADNTRIEAALAARGHTIADNNLEIGLVASIVTALVGMSASVVAETIGLHGVWIGAIRNDATETARILGLPANVYCVFGMCLGWPAEAPEQKPRMDYSQMVHYEHYGQLRDDSRTMEQALADYDKALAAHYTGTGRATTPDSWSHDMDKKFVPQAREALRAQLKAQGFDFR